MPRQAREKSSSGIYHIMLRGINRQDIFHDEEDKMRFIETLKNYKSICEYKVYGYCLMSNHIHLLIKEGKETISQAMKRIGASYVYWCNMKYERYGHLFQDRYKSEKVEDDKYLLVVLRYIHQNPIKAGIVEEAAKYK
jgi:REP element-mobilizing transposase RayT